MQKTLYQILGVQETASQEEILRAFEALRLGLQEKADRGDGEAANQLKFTNEAFAVLRNSESRRLYDEKRASSKAITSLRAPTINSVAVSGGDLDDKSDGGSLHGTVRQFRNYLRRRPATVVISVLLSLALSVGLWGIRPTEEGRLKSRAAEYMNLFKSLNFEAAYNYLAPDLRQRVSREGYVQSRSRDFGLDAKIVEVKVTEPSVRGYAIVESSAPGSLRERRTRIGWVMIDGEWYRDLASDRSDVVDQLLASSEQVKIAQSLPVALGLWDVRTRWNHTQTRVNASTTRHFVLPVTAFHVMNRGSAKIEFLDVMVEYYDIEAGALFGTVSGNLINYGKRPLVPGGMVRWINGDLNLRYELDFGQWSDTLRNQPTLFSGDNPVIDRIEVRIFAREAPKSPWVRLQ